MEQLGEKEMTKEAPRKIHGICNSCNFKGDFKVAGVCPDCGSINVRCRREKRKPTRDYHARLMSKNARLLNIIKKLQIIVNTNKERERVHHELFELLKHEVGSEKYYELVDKAYKNIGEFYKHRKHSNIEAKDNDRKS